MYKRQAEQGSGDSGAKEVQPNDSTQLSLGKRLFTSSAEPPCGACHRLDAAGARGVIGPDLDELKPNARRIRSALAQGVGAMPAYAEQLTETEITALVDFITSSQ